MIESNGVDSEESHELNLKSFDLVPYAESEIFKMCSSKESYDPHREQFYEIYEKAAGKYNPEITPEMTFEE